MYFLRRMTVALSALIILLLSATAHAQVAWDGNIYIKLLWGTDRLGTGLYNFTTIPGEGYGDSGQGSQLELFLRGRFAKKVEFRATIQSRFNRNFWTNFGGFAGFCCNGGVDPTNPNFDGSEFDPRSNQYIKLRGVQLVFTPGYKWFDSVVVGENDLGIYDPWVLGKIRYIDRFNLSALQISGNVDKRRFTWDAIRISDPFFKGPADNSGQFQPQDGTYGLQAKYKGSAQWDVGAIFEYANDIEVDVLDHDIDNGRSLVQRFKNAVFGLKGGFQPGAMFNFTGAFYHASSESNPNPIYNPTSYGLNGFGNVLLGKNDGNTYKVNVDINDPFQKGISFGFEYFNIGAEYSSLFAVRREADVLLTEGFDGAFVFPGPGNARFGIFSGGNPQPGFPSRVEIGYGGWTGETVQVPTIGNQTDNEFTDFDEQPAETVIGWKGFTIRPTFGTGGLDLTGEYSYIGNNSDWQAWNDVNRSLNDTNFPMEESDAGINSVRNSYAPFRDDKKTQIALIKVRKTFSNGVEVIGKYKHISDKDNRMNDPLFLPFQPGDCPGNGLPCNNVRNFYNPALGFSSADLYGNPPVITVNGVTGYQWKPFDSLGDDDRDMSYNMVNIGLGKQLTQDLYGSALYEYYWVDLQDGNTAFQAYNVQEMAAGEHHKNRLIFRGRYVLPGLPEAGFEYNYNWGNFEPAFGGGFVPQIADANTARDHNVALGSLGFFGRFGGWNSLERRTFSQQRLKVYLKIIF